MAARPLPPRELVRQLLAYDREADIFTWLERPREMFTSERSWKIWNKRFAGAPAGTISGLGYRAVTIHNIGYWAHRLVWLYHYGEPVPAGIDHIDGNRLNNKIENLRAATQTENLANAGIRKHNTSGVKGVYLHQGKFVAEISINGRSTYLGIFDTIEEATKIRQAAAGQRYGQFARHK